MADIQSNINVNIDTSAALANLKNLQREISATQRALSKSTASNAANARELQRGLLANINATGQFSANITKINSSSQTFTNALEKNKLSMGEYFRYAGASTKTFGRLFSSEFNTIEKVARERVKTIQTQFIKLGRESNGAIEAISVRPLMLDMDNLATKTAIAAQKQQVFNQLMKQGSTNLLNFGKNTQWAGRQLMVGFTIPITMLGTQAAKTFMQMEEQAIRFKRVYGDTFTATEETDAMLKQIKSLASEFTKYGVAVEKTMELAATAAASGKAGADLLAQVSEATRLAVLGGVEQSQALEATISVTNAFGVAADRLAGKIDFLNAVENQTVTAIEDLTIAIPKAGPVVQQLGGNVEDLAFFLTAMKEGGINASEGANALKSGLAALINPTEKASQFLSGFNINLKSIVEANKGDVKGLVVDFASALDTLDPLSRARAIEQLFGKFQFSRLSTLFQNVIAEGSQASRVLKLTNASTAELAILSERELKKIEESPMFKFRKAFEDLKVSLAPVGEAFLKAVTPFLNFGVDLLKKFNELSEGGKSFIVGLTVALGLIGPVAVMTFGLLANGVAQIIKGFMAVRGVFSNAGKASTTLGEQTEYMTQQQLEAAAVAASLDQTHNKLTQTFNLERSAINNLTAAYTKAVAAQARFNVAAIPTTLGKGRKTQKLADGIVSVPGPKGAGDIIPAMLSPGEAVIPADKAQKYSGFIRGMIAGNIPGFEQGLAGGFDFAHYGPGSQIPVSEALNDPRLALTPGLKRRMETLRDVDPLAPVNLKTAYGAKMERSVNINLGKVGGANAEDVSKQFSGKDISDRYGEMFKLIGEDKKDPQLVKEFEAYDNAMSKKINELKNTGIKKIVDTEEQLNALPENQRRFTRSIESLDKEVIDQIGTDNRRLVSARSKALSTVRDVRIGEGLTPQQIEKIKADPIKNRSLLRRVDSTSNRVRVGTSNQRRAGGGFGVMPGLQATGVPYVGSQAQNLSKEYGKLSAIDILDSGKKILGQEKNDPVMLQRSRKRNSPHPQAAIDGRDDARARVAAARKETEKLSKADKTAASLQSNYGGAQVVTPQMRAERKQAEKLARQERFNAREAARQRRLEESLQAPMPNQAAATRQRQTTNRQSLLSRLRPGRGAVVGGAMGVSSIAMGASMIPGKVGEVAGNAMGPIMAISGIVSALQMLPMPIALAVGAIGALAYGMYAFNDSLKKGTESGIKLANSMSMTQEKMTELSKITGTVSATDAREKRNQTILSGMSQKQISEGETLLQTDVGAGMLADIQTQRQSGRGGLDIGKNIGTQFATAISQGVLTSEQAQSLAAALSEKMKDYSIQVGVVGQLNSLIGLDGKDLKNNPLEVRLAIQKQSMADVENSFTTAVSNLEPTVTPGGAARMTAGAGLVGAGAVTAATGAGIIPGAIMAGVGALAMGSALIEQNIAMAENNKLRAAATQLSVQQVAANQGAVDSLTREYDIKIKNAKTDEEIIRLQKEKAESLKVLNLQNAQQLEAIRAQAGTLGAANFTNAINTSVDELYKDADAATKTFVNQTKKDLSSLEDSDFKTNLQIGLASGVMDFTTVNAIIQAASKNKDIEAKINASINVIGMADAALITNMVKNMGGADSTLSTTLDFVTKNPEELQNVVSGLQYIQQQRLIGVNIDINSKDGAEKAATIGKALADIQSYPDVITKTQLQELKAKNPTAFAAAYKMWSDISGSDDVVTKKLILDIMATGDGAMISRYLATDEGKKFAANLPVAASQQFRDTQIANEARKFAATADIVPPTKAGGGGGGGGTGGGTGVDLIEELKKGIRDAKISESLSAKNIAPGLVQMLSTASRKTQDLYLSIKNGQFILTKQGQALKKAFDNKVINDFVASQQGLVSSSAMELKAREHLIKAGFDQAKAIELAANADIRAAYASAIATKDKTAQAKAIQEVTDAVKRGQAAENTLKTPEQLFNELSGRVRDKISAERDRLQINFELKTQVDAKTVAEAEAQIAKIQSQISGYQRSLREIENQEETISKSYEARYEALDKIEKANSEIADQQRQQIDFAQALSSGDIAAAARAARDMRAKQAAAALASQREALDASKEAELARVRSNSGLTRLELETKIKGLEADILKIEQDRLASANERIRLAGVERDTKLAALSAEELKWRDLQSQIDIAKSKTVDYVKALLEANALLLEFNANQNLNVPGLPAGSTSGASGSGGTGGQASVVTVKGNKPVTFNASTSSTTSMTTKALQSLVKTGKEQLAAVQKTASTAKTVAQRQDSAESARWLAQGIASAQAQISKNNSLPVLHRASGGMVPQYLAMGGYAKGTDVVPAMLTPGEFIVSRGAAANLGLENLKAINSGNPTRKNPKGLSPQVYNVYDNSDNYNQMKSIENKTSNYASVYNSYGISVNVRSGANPEEIARVVTAQIQKTNDQRLRGNRY